MQVEVLQMAWGGEGLEFLYPSVEEEAKQPIAVPNEQEDDCTLVEQQVEHVVQVLLSLSLSLSLSLFLFLVVGEGEVQPAAEPNEQEGDDTVEQVQEAEKEQEKDHHWSCLAAVVVEVAVQAEACASYGHDVECDGGQGY